MLVQNSLFAFTNGCCQLVQLVQLSLGCTIIEPGEDLTPQTILVFGSEHVCTDATSVFGRCVGQVAIDQVSTLQLCCLAVGVSRKEAYKDVS